MVLSPTIIEFFYSWLLSPHPDSFSAVTALPRKRGIFSKKGF
jgi:hypothetical protein